MKVVIVGGGFAGVKSALELANTQGVEVDLICPNQYLHVHGSIDDSSLTFGDNTVLDIRELFSRFSNIRVLKDEISALNAKVKAVKCRSGAIYRYDKLLVCIGTDKSAFSVAGVSDYSHHAYTQHAVLELENALKDALRIPHRNNIRVIIVGGGLTGVQLAGSVDRMASIVSDRYSIPAKKVHIELISASVRLLTEMSESASRHALKRLEKLGVNVSLGKTVHSFGRNSVRLHADERAADIVIWAGGTMLHSFFAGYPEVFEVSNNKVKVNERLQVVKSPDIYILGDSADTQYNGMAETALAHAERVTHTLLAEIGSRKHKLVTPKPPIFVVPIGKRWAIVQSGKKVYSGRSGWARRSSNPKILADKFKLPKVKS